MTEVPDAYPVALPIPYPHSNAKGRNSPHQRATERLTLGARLCSGYLERVIAQLPGCDLAVQLQEAAIRLSRVVGDNLGPAIRGCNCLVEAQVHLLQVSPSALIYLVVKGGQADVFSATDVASECEQTERGRSHRITV